MGQPSWWYTASAKDRHKSNLWYFLLEYFPKNALKYGIARVAISSDDGNHTFEHTFSADEMAALHSRRNALEWLRDAVESGTEELVVSGYDNDYDDSCTLNVGTSQLKLDVKIELQEFMQRVILYEANSRSNVLKKQKDVAKLEETADNLEKKALGETRKMDAFQSDVMHTVRVLMREKMNHDYDAAYD